MIFHDLSTRGSARTPVQAEWPMLVFGSEALDRLKVKGTSTKMKKNMCSIAVTHYHICISYLNSYVSLNFHDSIHSTISSHNSSF